MQLLKTLQQSMPVQLADDEDVDVAADIVVTAGIGAEQEGIADRSLALEDLPQLRGDPHRSRVEIAERPIQGIRRIHPPHAQRTHASAFDQSLPQQLLKRELHGPRATANSTHKLARVELLAWRARKQGEQASLRR